MNKFGQVSRFELTVSSKNSQSFIQDSFFTSPFKIMKPFQNEDGSITVFQQSSSAGILAGDCQEHKIQVKKDGKVKILSQSFEKIFKMNEDEKAERKININLEENSLLVYSPLPCIPFSQSSFSSKTRIFLKDRTSRLIYEDILCGGRIAFGESFDWNTYSNLIEIKRDGKLIFRDNAFYEGSNGNKNPEAKKNLESGSVFSSFTHSGTLLLFGFDKKISEIRKFLALEEKLLYTEEFRSKNHSEKTNDRNQSIMLEASKTDSGDIVLRALAMSAQKIISLFDFFIQWTFSPE